MDPAAPTALVPLRPALARWLGGVDGAPDDLQADDLAALVAHGLDGLAAARRATSAGPALGVDVALRRRRAALVAAEAAARPALDAALVALRAAGLDPLLFKGEALARGLYREPGTRVRGDADVWVSPAAFDAACGVLAGLGWRAVAAADGEWLQPERSFLDPTGCARIDLHRRILSQPLLDAALDAPAIRARADRPDGIALPAPADALLIAAAHLVGHHADAPRAIWLYDLHRLAADDATRRDAADRAIARGIAGILGHALGAAQALFGTELDQDLLARLAAAGRHERSARLLRPMSPARRLGFDFATLPGWRARATWLRELLLPDARWLRAREGDGPLPWLLLRRALRGLRARAR
jgi:hypothetical protein